MCISSCTSGVVALQPQDMSYLCFEAEGVVQDEGLCSLQSEWFPRHALNMKLTCVVRGKVRDLHG